MIKFKVGNDRNDLQINVLIYDNLKSMRRASKRFQSRFGFSTPRGYFSDVCGLMQPYIKYKVSKNNKDIMDVTDVGSILLSKDCLNLEVISHECCHAALWIYRIMNKGRYRHTANFGKDCDDKEEELCYIQGQLLNRVMGEIIERKL